MAARLEDMCVHQTQVIVNIGHTLVRFGSNGTADINILCVDMRLYTGQLLRMWFRPMGLMTDRVLVRSHTSP